MSEGTLSIENLKKALEAYDWPAMRRLLDAAGGAASDANDIAEAIRRASGLVIKYPGAAEKKRDALLNQVELYLSAGQADTQAPDAIAEALGTLRVAEAGYRELVELLSQTEASKLEPTVHVAATIQRAERELAHMVAEFESQVVQMKAITPHTRHVDEFGTPVDLNSASEQLVEFVSMTLQMEAFRHRWFSPDGTLVVPSLPEVTEEAINQSGSTLLLAMMWRRWRLTEERARVLGRKLRFLSANERPIDAPEELSRFVVEEGDASSDWLHRIALERVGDKLSQNMLETLVSANLNQGPVTRVITQRALPPHDWICDEEIHGIWGLQQYLSYDILGDNATPGGLRLVEWVRGYCALMLLSREATADALVRTLPEWQEFLEGFGLPPGASEALISRLTFGRSSRDLFDHPFIKLGDGRYRLFALGLRYLSVPIVVLSTLSNLSVQLPRKGKSFEKTVRETFEKAGIKPYAFKATRNNEEYEYDAVVPWGDYLFVIECKNRSLPFGNPIQMHYFDLQTQEHIGQVHRLMKALEDYPDILADNLPPDAATKTRVPVIINNFPYSAPGTLDGVYHYDYSALARFFENGELRLMASRPGKTVAVGSGLRLWAGKEPTPEDLLAQFEGPLQFKTVMDSLKLDRGGFQLSKDWWVFDVSFIRTEPEHLKVPGTTAPHLENQQS